MVNRTNQRTLDELLVQLKNIVGIWHKGTRPGNDGNQGNTLEDLLGVPENNLSIPDFGIFELKTQRVESGSRVSLVHKEPYPPKSTPEIVQSVGWNAGAAYLDDELSFRHTVYGDKFTERGFRINLTDEKVEFTFDPTHVLLKGKIMP